MNAANRRTVRTIEWVLALGTLAVAAITFTAIPQPYPSWPTIGRVPVNPELIIPGLLGLVAIFGAIVDGLSVGSVVTAILGVVTLGMAISSLHTLYAVQTGGVFWGGLFTLVPGFTLAGVVLVRDVGKRLALLL
jgi:hypothetical protein